MKVLYIAELYSDYESALLTFWSLFIVELYSDYESCIIHECVTYLYVNIES